ncbi:MAG: hypothetical protein HUU17_12725 [Chthonomonadales bacterium]|nr:hypothetical protein [Chthonomonadales bacterium]
MKNLPADSRESLDIPTLRRATDGWMLYGDEKGWTPVTRPDTISARRSRPGAALQCILPCRDTRGPALPDPARLLQAPVRTTLRGKRDDAQLVLFCENALRRGELHRCKVSDFDAPLIAIAARFSAYPATRSSGR